MRGELSVVAMAFGDLKYWKYYLLHLEIHHIVNSIDNESTYQGDLKCRIYQGNDICWSYFWQLIY